MVLKRVALQQRWYSAPPAARMHADISGASAWLLLLMALTLAILNPLACLIHCLRYDATPQAAASPFAFSCHLPQAITPNTTGPSTPSHSAAANPAIPPQAVYPFVVFTLALAAITLVTWPAEAWSFSFHNQTYSRPPVPPPQSQSL